MVDSVWKLEISLLWSLLLSTMLPQLRFGVTRQLAKSRPSMCTVRQWPGDCSRQYGAKANGTSLMKLMDSLVQRSMDLVEANPRQLFTKGNNSWSNTVMRARKMCNYNIDVYKRLKNEFQAIETMNYKQFLKNEYFKHFSRFYYRTYNYQVTGLVTILLTKLYLYSANCSYPEETIRQIESDINRLAQSYDLISYGFYFHDITSYEEDSLFGKSLRNLMILFGDYFLVKSNYEAASFNEIDLYRLHVSTTLRICEGESISFENYDSQLESSVESNTSDQCKQKFIDYCFQTYGILIANSLKSAFKLAKFDEQTQLVAYEFGLNLGIAIKITNQLSAKILLQISTGEQSRHSGKVNEFPLTNFVKFPSVNVESMLALQSHYLHQSIQQLRLLGIGRGLWPGGQRSSTLLERLYGTPSREKVNTTSLTNMLLHLIEELANFNHTNLEILNHHKC